MAEIDNSLTIRENGISFSRATETVHSIEFGSGNVPTEINISNLSSTIIDEHPSQSLLSEKAPWNHAREIIKWKSPFLWMLQKTAFRSSASNTGDSDAMVDISNNGAKLPSTSHCSALSISTSELQDYAAYLHAAQQCLASGTVPPATILRKVAELLKVDRVPAMMSNCPSLVDLLRADAEAVTEGERKTVERDMKRRRQLLNEIVHGRGSRMLHRDDLNIPQGVRTRAELELRMLRLRQFQTVVRQKILLADSSDPHSGKTGDSDSFRFNRYLLNRLAASKKRSAEAAAAETEKLNASVKDTAVSTGTADQQNFGANISGVFEKISLQCTKRLSRHINPEHRILRRKLDRLLEDLPSHYRRLRKGWSKLKENIKNINTEATRRVEAILQRKEAIREKHRKERMKLLKENDFGKYLELVKQSKNARIEELLNQTDRFLESVTHKVELQQRDTLDARTAQQQAALKAKQRHRNKNYTEPIETPGDNTSPTSDDQLAAAAHPSMEEIPTAPDLITRPASATGLYLTVADQDLGETVVQPALLVGGKLMPYQLSGLQFLINLYSSNLSGILADEMGLGKTIQTIALLAYLKEFKAVDGPHLIIVPLSTLPNWMCEFDRWCPSLAVIEYRGNRQERRILSRSVRRGDFNVCVTTYDWIIREKATLSVPHWGFIIVDEGHRMKNARSKFHITLSDFQSTHRLLLTGTPLQNNLSELWSLLNFLLPRIFTSVTDFELWFEEPFKNFPGQEAVELTEEEKFLIINRLHAVLRPFLLRRIKEDVLKDLPTKREYIVRVQLSAWQKHGYEQLSNKALRIQTSSGKLSHRSFANVMMQLRKIVNHPYLFEDEYYINDDLYRVSGKFEVLDRMLPKIIQFGHKTLIFCQMTQLMDILDDYLDYKEYKHCRLDGSTLLEDRRDRTETFNDPSSETLIFTLSTRAGGLGLNLQAADTVIIFDSDWNPHQDLQAQARAHRMGQKNEVRVFKLVTVSGIEEAVLSKAQHKLDIDEKIIQAGMFNNKGTEEERQSRLRMLLYSKDSGLDARVTTPQELNRFMARTEEEEQCFQSYDETLFGAESFQAFEQRCPLPSFPKPSHMPDVNSTAAAPSESSSTSAGKVALRRAARTMDTDLDLLRSATSDMMTFDDSNDKLDSPSSSISNTPEEPRHSYRTRKRGEDMTEISKSTGRKTKQRSVAKKGPRQTEEQMKTDDATTTEITEETLLIKSNRLMGFDEIPAAWLQPEPSGEPSEAGATQSNRADRRAKSDLRRVNADSLTEASFARALCLLETGEVGNLEAAISLEKARLQTKREKEGSSKRRRQMSDDGSDAPLQDVAEQPVNSTTTVVTRSKRRRTDEARPTKTELPTATRSRRSAVTAEVTVASVRTKEDARVTRSSIGDAKPARGVKLSAPAPPTSVATANRRRDRMEYVEDDRKTDQKNKDPSPKSSGPNYALPDISPKTDSTGSKGSTTTTTALGRVVATPSSRLRRRAVALIDGEQGTHN